MVDIRRAQYSDLLELATLFDAYRVFYRRPSDLSASSSFIENRLKNNDSEIFIGEKESVLVGFTQLYPLFSSTRMQKLWLLNDLYVAPKFRGEGISVLLIERAKKHAVETGAQGLSLATEKTNVIGNQLYPRAGFELDKEYNYYFWQNK
jgi:ribosomal protein S18 acetylase RimI-like enzyme